MPAIARGQASSCTNPLLDLYVTRNGLLTDVEVLEFEIWDLTVPIAPAQVYPLTGRQAVDLAACPTGDRIGAGHYVARWTPDGAEPIGSHEIRWFFRVTSALPEQTFVEEFEVLAAAVASGGSTAYATVADMRAEGVTTEMASDAQVQAALERASRFIDRVTRRFFSPREMTLTVDGSGRGTLFLDVPIIALSAARVGGDLLALTDLRVFNRHVASGLTSPDDRDNPKIQFTSGGSGWGGTWVRGTQNVELTGIFGYTEYDGTPLGRTPALIARATMLIAARDLVPVGAADQRFSDRSRYRIKDERTRDQSVSYGDAAAGGATPWTGDPEVDGILDLYRALPVVRVP